MIKTLLIVVAALVAGALIFASTKPDTFRVVRSATIKAPPDKLFALINDFRAWGSWSPYEKKDGPASFFSKVMQVFINMDKMVGTDFEAGLDNLKAVAEKS